jgi:transcriptional regulator with XRE-family HTH domain
MSTGGMEICYFIIISRASYALTVLFCSWGIPLAPSSSEDEKRILRTLGIQLRIARERAGLSQGQVAERIGTVQSFISAVESGRANLSLRTLIRITRAVECIPLIHAVPTNLISPEELIQRVRAIDDMSPSPPFDRVASLEMIERSLEEIHFLMFGLRDQVDKLRSPGLTETEPSRPRRGRRPKKRTPEAEG